MKVLNIVDVSAVMRTNYVAVPSDEELEAQKKQDEALKAQGKKPRFRKMVMTHPVNGTHVNTSAMYGLFRLIAKHGLDADYVFCFDTPENFLKNDNPTYKAGRVKPNNDYFDQLNKARKILEDCNFQVLSKSGYEADHFIVYAHEQLSPYYDKVQVITNDKDLAVCVDEKTDWVNVIQKRGDITYDTYEEKLDCPYNAIRLKKALVGDKSDNIMGVYRFGEAAFRKFVLENGLDRENIYGREKEIILESLLTEDQKLQAMDALHLVLPLEVPNVPVDIMDQDFERLGKYCKKYGMKSLLATFGG